MGILFEVLRIGETHLISLVKDGTENVLQSIGVMTNITNDQKKDGWILLGFQDCVLTFVQPVPTNIIESSLREI